MLYAYCIFKNINLIHGALSNFLSIFFLHHTGPRACQANPCGRNALCQDSPDGAYRCICQEGYTGDPFRGCVGKSTLNL